MTDYRADKGMCIIVENIIKGILFMLPLYFDGFIRELMYFVLAIFIGKGIYDLYKASTIKVHFLAYLYMVVAGVFTGWCLGFLGMSMLYGLVLEFHQSILRLILSSIPILAVAIFLAYKLDAHPKNL